MTAKDEKSTSKVLRENRGDLFVGLLYTMEASGPFVAIRHLLQLTNKAQYFPDKESEWKKIDLHNSKKFPNLNFPLF